MILEHGDMFQVFGKTDLFLVTTNSVVWDDHLVMGAGAAGQLRDKLPGIDHSFGYRIKDNPAYGLITVYLPEQTVGAFQTKHDWKDPALLSLIQLSTGKLFKWLISRPTARVDMNFPGIGYGQLPEELVLPIIKLLPDNVHVWRND